MCDLAAFRRPYQVPHTIETSKAPHPSLCMRCWGWCRTGWPILQNLRLTYTSIRTVPLARMDASPARASRVSPIECPLKWGTWVGKSLGMRVRTAVDVICIAGAERWCLEGDNENDIHILGRLKTQLCVPVRSSTATGKFLVNSVAFVLGIDKVPNTKQLYRIRVIRSCVALNHFPCQFQLFVS